MTASEQRYGRAETRTRILDAAWDLVDSDGGDATMARVAERAGVSRQAVYLHFVNRSGLLTGLVDHMDRHLGLGELAAVVWDAANGREALAEMVALHAVYTGRIIGVARLLDTARHDDPAFADAWEDRMSGRRVSHRRIVQWIADDGDLAAGWDVDSAAALFHAVTLPRVWDELVTEQGWTTDEYREHVTRLLSNAFVAGG